GGDGEIRLAGGKRLALSSLDKPYFPQPRLTKGDVMRYYARVARWILPVLRDRPLVLKRSPEGIDGEFFFQQKPPATAEGVARVRVIDTEIGAQERVIGGDLATMLYVVQIGCISMDPWGSRVRSLDAADYAVLDLDPGPKASFGRVVVVALAVKEVLDALGLHAVPKTSGSRGIHIAVPLPLRTSFEDAQALGERVATRVAEAHPRIATVERSLDDRPPGAVYVDFLQNARGKSVAAAYSVRAKPGATVSTPLDWGEVGPALDPHAFTILSVPERIAARGDLWREGMRRRNPARAVRAALA
ncbi:MAG TPA: non-homologous end-joining DNA ligase, partial [Gemmatimonadaceae bacterium]|nr:non-homologous end-joining DNA ligase [Gemmatimonadaceae bacterium]